MIYEACVVDKYDVSLISKIGARLIKALPHLRHHKERIQVQQKRSRGT